MLGYFIFKILPAVGASVYTIYLAYVIYDQSRLKAKMSSVADKYKKTTPVYELYRKMYTRKYLFAWVLISLSLMLGVGIDFYKSAGYPLVAIVTAAQIILLLLLFVGLYLLSAALRAK